MEWQPIETAPKDGTYLLLYFPELRQPVSIEHWSNVVHTNHGKETYRREGWSSPTILIPPGGKSFLPTHWMPLPAPPQQ